MSVACEIAAPLIANSVVEGVEIVGPLRPHTSTCLKCQARHAVMSRTARVLGSMADEKTLAPPDLEWRVMSGLQEEESKEPYSSRTPTVFAALLSVAAALIIWRLRPIMRPS